MAAHVRHFDRAKALEAILFIANKLKQPTFHSISKMFYLADKGHLEEYGRLICGDQYIAMEYGPVPSAVYNMMKVAAGRERVDVDWDEIIKEAFSVRQGRNIVPSRSADDSLLSESEVECLEAAIAQHGSKSFGQLTDLTHDGAWNSTADDQPIPLAEIVKTLPNAAVVAEYVFAH